MAVGAGDVYNKNSGGISLDMLLAMLNAGNRILIAKTTDGYKLQIDSTIKGYLVGIAWTGCCENGGVAIQYFEEGEDYPDEPHVFVIPYASAVQDGLLSASDYSLFMSLIGGINWVGSSDFGKSLDITNANDIALINNAANAITQTYPTPRNVQTGDVFRNVYDGVLFIYEGGQYPNGHWVSMGGGFGNVQVARNRTDPTDTTSQLGLVAGLINETNNPVNLFDQIKEAQIIESKNGLIGIQAATNYQPAGGFSGWTQSGGSDSLGVVRGFCATGYIRVADGSTDLPLLSPSEDPTQASQMRRGTMFSPDIISLLSRMDNVENILFSGSLSFNILTIVNNDVSNPLITTSVNPNIHSPNWTDIANFDFIVIKETSSSSSNNIQVLNFVDAPSGNLRQSLYMEKMFYNYRSTNISFTLTASQENLTSSPFSVSQQQARKMIIAYNRILCSTQWSDIYNWGS